MKGKAYIRRKRIVGLMLIASACLSGGCTSPSSRSCDGGRPFTIIALPDTQMYAESYPDIFISQTRWIKDHKNELNIVCVVHEGDITNNNVEKEWEAANEAISVLDDVVPYCLAIGNHDYVQPSNYTEPMLFNTYFPVSRFNRKPWYGGHFANGMENAFYFISVGGVKFLVLCLEFGPRDEVLKWANKVVAEHMEVRTIIVTHCYMNFDDTRVGEEDAKYNPHKYTSGRNDGEDMWDKFVRRHGNIFLVLSGHIIGDGLGKLTSIGDNGNKVHQILANYQMKTSGGNGWLRIMTFVPSENKILVRTYSPWLKEYASDEQNEFKLEYDVKRSPSAGHP